jgi:hypothetical protein
MIHSKTPVMDCRTRIGAATGKAYLKIVDRE